jgi:hypothetical protein
VHECVAHSAMEAHVRSERGKTIEDSAPDLCDQQAGVGEEIG